MKFALIIFGLAGAALCQEALPSFRWHREQSSHDGVPLLEIDFHDGQPNDFAVLTHHNPIPKQDNELEENIDNCIFKGYLRDEPTAVVALTGGCSFGTSFEIQFKSRRHSERMFQVSNGKVTVVPSIFKDKRIAIHSLQSDPGTESSPSRFHPSPSNGYRIKVSLNYENSFALKFGGDAYNVMRRTVTHAETLYQDPSLGTTITWELVGNKYILTWLVADEDSLERAGRHNSPDVNTNVYWCYEGNEPGTVGISVFGSACGAEDQRTTIVEYYNGDMATGQILAHEVGHTLGMNHDYEGTPEDPAPRYDSQGNLCTDIGGVMDAGGTMDQWSTCSLEDFYNANNDCLSHN